MHILYLISLTTIILFYVYRILKRYDTCYIQTLEASSGKYRSKYPDIRDFRNKFSGNQTTFYVKLNHEIIRKFLSFDFYRLNYS